MTYSVLEALESTIDSSFGSGFNRREKSDSRYNGEIVLSAHSISLFLQNVDDDMTVVELRDQLDEIGNKRF